MIIIILRTVEQKTGQTHVKWTTDCLPLCAHKSSAMFHFASLFFLFGWCEYFRQNEYNRGQCETQAMCRRQRCHTHSHCRTLTMTRMRTTTTTESPLGFWAKRRPILSGRVCVLSHRRCRGLPWVLHNQSRRRSHSHLAVLNVSNVRQLFFFSTS